MHDTLNLPAVLLLGACLVGCASTGDDTTSPADGAQPLEAASTDASPFTVVEADFADLQAAMAEGRATSRDIVEQYLARIAMYDTRLRATLAVNPHALEEADRLDRERAAGRVRGPFARHPGRP